MKYIYNQDNNNFNAIKISIASPNNIRSWSNGEINKADTVNYRTVKPENDGLFCSKIFGPVQDYECLCGKYKKIKHQGIKCEKCQVEVTTSKVRRERMGHIELASPITHIWFLKSMPSRISMILDIGMKKIEKVLNYDAYIISDSGVTNFDNHDLITEEQYKESITKFGEYSFKAGIGPEIIREMLKSINLRKIKKKISLEIIRAKSDIMKKKIIKRIRLVDDFIFSENKLEWMILTVLPIMPPELRPLVMLEGGRFATSDLNELYRRVLNRNNRLKKLIELKAPEIIIRNEKRMLQESVDALFDNNKKDKIARSSNRRQLKSLSDMLKGKHGRFRQNLLGKRVDYSGRSVITVGAELRLKQCGLPKKMAIELMKPFIYSKLELYRISRTIKEAKKMVEEQTEEVWDILDEVIRGHPIFLNRAPTLHRLSIQSFEPILINNKAIQLHPLVCAAFNADFDGDQMAVHIPLSIEAQLESRILMMSSNNILNPANGEPIVVPTQDIILGIYYLSLITVNNVNKIVFNKIYEVEHAIISEIISIHTAINFKIENEIIKTTPGRLFIANLLPINIISIKSLNKVITKQIISDFINKIYRKFEQNITIRFVDGLMKLGFHYACKSGITIGKNDIIIPKTKKIHILRTYKIIKEYENQYKEGLITSQEKYNKSINTWSICTDKISQDMIKYIKNKKNVEFKNINNMFIMANSGARGSYDQIRQLAGIRGLMTKPSGEVIETPIISNFKEGLNTIEYFISTHGARKGLSDTALKTANSGYLTRKLVDVSQDCIINEHDCDTNQSIMIKTRIENGEVIFSLRELLLGRVIQKNIIIKKKKKIIKRGTLIDEYLMSIIEEAKINSIEIRSPIFCNSINGICQKCYGRDLSTGKIISLGEAVGVIAAQSIGEPGTQLTMRTFHVGGTAQKIDTKSDVISNCKGIIKINNMKTIKNKKNNTINMSKNGEIIIIGENILKSKIPYGAKIFINNKKIIKEGKKISEWDPFTIPIIVENSGYIKYIGIKEDITIKNIQDNITGITKNIIVENKYEKIKPKITIVNKRGEIIVKHGKKVEYYLPVGAIINVKNKQKIIMGDIIAKIPKKSSKNRDITGGLPRVVELFEARQPKSPAVISEIDGYVKYEKKFKFKKKITIKGYNKKKSEYIITDNKYIHVNHGDYIEKGDIIINGNPSPHDILSILGREEFAHFMINEIQKIYKLQGVKINNKHIEIILKQMIGKVEILDAGDTIFTKGEQVKYENLERINNVIRNNNQKEAKAIHILQGITKASLETNSFLSAASFQETIKILTEASIASRYDNLTGLKENIITGRLIPAGTGYYKKIK